LLLSAGCQCHVVGRNQTRAGQEDTAGRDGILAHHPRRQLFERAAHPCCRGLGFVDNLAVRAAEAELDLERLRPVLRNRDRRAERAGGGEELGLGEVEGVLALHVACRHVVADRGSEQLAVGSQNERELRLRHRPRGIGADSHRSARSDGSTAACVLHEQLRTVGVVDEAVDVSCLNSTFVDASVTASFVRDAGRPGLGRNERRKQLERRRQLERLGIERCDRPSRNGALPAQNGEDVVALQFGHDRRRIRFDEPEPRLVTRLPEADDPDQ